ncbi:MAG: thrombospondin type 3 repeat-containing protein [Acidobacteriota bacterium]
MADGKLDEATLFDPVTDTVLGTVDFSASPFFSPADCVLSPDNSVALVADFSSRLWAIDLTRTPPALAAAPNPIPISNPGEDVSITSDGRFVVTCDGGTVTPVSVVDVDTRTEIHTFSLDSNCNSVDVCGDDSVLVSSTAGSVRRLTIDAAGVLTDTGEVLGTSSPLNTSCVPGGKSGLVIGSGTISSFTVLGLSLVDRKDLSAIQVISASVNRAGNRVYVRSNNAVDLFGYDSVTATFSEAPLLTIPLLFGTTPFFGVDQMALDPTETKLYVSQPDAVNVYDAETGALLSQITAPSIDSPSGLCVTVLPDSDRDGLADEEEAILGTDPANSDTDGDGLLDGFEVDHGFDPLAPGEELGDPDGDGLDNLAEQAARTDPNNPDTDGDGVPDGAEVNSLGTDPRRRDTDGDTVTDGADNCPLTSNAEQADGVHPGGPGDACDDPDADGVFDREDNCPDTPNPGQEDLVHPNGTGDACEDPDADGVPDSGDNCPDLSNLDQSDADADQVGDPCDVCPQLKNPGQQELVGCAEVTEDGGQCLETAIELVDQETTGEVLLFGTEVLESVTLDFLATSCDSADPIEFFLNGHSLGTVAADPLLACSCIPEAQELVVDDSVFLQTLWNPRAANTLRFSKDGSGTGIAWVSARLDFVTVSKTTCLFDFDGGDCSATNLCVGGLTFDPVAQDTAVPDPFTDVPVSSTAFAGPRLPELIDIRSLASGPAEICVKTDAAGPSKLIGNSFDGRLFTLNLETGAGTQIGRLLPTFLTVTEIEFDNISRRGFYQLSGPFAGREFDITDGSPIGGFIMNGGNFHGLEYIGSDLYGTVQFGFQGPFQLRILSPFTGASTLIGPTGAGPISGLAFDEKSGILFGIEGFDGRNLLVLDRTTGQTTVVGPTGIQAGSLQFGPDGNLYAGGTSFPDSGKLFRIDPATGASTLVGPTGFFFVTGLTLAEGPPPVDCVGFLHQGEATVAINGAPCGPPIADAGPDLQEECVSPATPVALNGAGSSDPNSTPGTNDDIVLFEWFVEFGTPTQTLIGTGETVQVSLPVGLTVVTLRVTDSFGETSVDEVLVNIVDTTPPALTVDLDPPVLWPPNHRLVPVTASVTASDACGAAQVSILSVTSSEPDDAEGDGDGKTAQDIQDVNLGTADFDLLFRAERDGAGDGRAYTAVYRAVDGSGNTRDATGTAVVPHALGGVIEPLALTVRQSGNGTVVAWQPVAGGLYYNVIRGGLADVVEGGAAIRLDPVLCIDSHSLDTSTLGEEDTESPPPGKAFFYLAEYNGGGTMSSYGSESVLRPRVVGVGGCQ